MAKEYISKILDIKDLGREVKIFTLDIGEKFDFIPGQFVMLNLSDDKEILKRPYSLASIPGKNTIDLCISIISKGKASVKLNKAKIGGKIKISGPYGVFGKKLLDIKNNLLFIATGTGVAPFRGIIPNLLKKGFDKKITLLYGFRHEEDYLFKEEFEELSKKYDDFTILPVVSQPNSSKKWERIGRVTNFLKDFLNTDQDYVLCGFSDMVKEVQTILLKNNIPKEKIHQEKWG